MRLTKYLVACGLAVSLFACTQPPPADDSPASRQQDDPVNATHGAPGAGDPYYPHDGNGGYDALAYDVSISYDPKRARLDGDSSVTAKATKDLSRFNLDLRELKVKSVEVDGERAEFTRAGQFELVITPNRPIAEGAEFTTRVRYGGSPTTKEAGKVGALGWHTTSSGAAYALGEPHSAAFWYPVNETPRDKATFKLSARVPEGWTAVSGGREGKHETKGGWITYRWSDTNPVASYLTTIAVDKFSVDRSKLSNGIPVVSAFAPGAEDKRAIEGRLDEVVKFLSEKFGPYPQTAAGGIYMGESIPFALETQGRPTYANWAELRVVVHEYAHQWFGNSVTVRSWSDLCLNECFASYIEWLWEEEHSGADLDAFYRQMVGANPAGTKFWQNKLHQMGSGKEFDGVYDKGSLAMHALRRAVGDKVFLRALKDWARTHQHSNASWPEFEAHVSKLSGKDLGEFFDAWFRGSEIPAKRHLYPGKLGG